MPTEDGVSQSLTVAESFPVQNQAASQKLLQKMSQPTRGNHRTRGQRHRGKGKEEDSHLLTLDEWERSKTGNFSGTQKLSDISQDEDLARQLQEQFDLEDVHVSYFMQRFLSSFIICCTFFGLYWVDGSTIIVKFNLGLSLYILLYIADDTVTKVRREFLLFSFFNKWNSIFVHNGPLSTTPLYSTWFLDLSKC